MHFLITTPSTQTSHIHRHR